MKKQAITKGYAERFSGIGRLYGQAGMEKLAGAHVAVVGIGGVGSWTVEALARSGIGELTLIDLDSLCITNTNRQIHAVEGQVGREKAAAMADRAKLINPEISVHEEIEFFTENTAEELLAPGFDCVVDAIDSVKHKCFLIATCRDREIPLVVCGGAGGKTDPAGVSRDDLAFATNDRLLKMVRKRLRAQYDFPPEPTKAPFHIPAVFSTENARYPWANGTVCDRPEPGSALQLDCESGFGTATQVTGTFGFAAAAAAIQLILQQ
ncbi:MAG: tRNA threonylcarbamoyladenosine dehydratase [Verrucomicrobiales bacterium]|nr:tRNA threonylcarbamoyladenosine dehydratase [Verrucomicrobiales bacterium]